MLNTRESSGIYKHETISLKGVGAGGGGRGKVLGKVTLEMSGICTTKDSKHSSS